MADDARAALLEGYRAISDADLDRLTTILADDAAAPLLIGTSAGDWVQGRQAIVDAFRKQFAQYPGIRFEPGEVQSAIDGNVSWISDQPTLYMPDGTELPARHTAVFRRLDGSWRLVSSHLSVGTVDGDAL